MIAPYSFRTLIGIVLIGCLAANDGAAYDVGAGDVLKIQVGDEPTLSGEFPVSEEGSIVYPLLGALKVAGKDLTMIAEEIRKLLAADYLVSPQVAVYMSNYGSKTVAVLGDVPSPGFYTLKKDTSILSVLAEAGLALSGGDRTLIITRASEMGKKGETLVPTVIKLEKLQSPWHTDAPVALSAGDRIYVKSDSAGKVFVSGKVKRPGMIPLSANMTLVEAINQAGGVAEFGSLKGVRVIRETKEGTDVINVDLNAVMEGARSNDVIMQDGDIVIVPRRWF